MNSELSRRLNAHTGLIHVRLPLIDYSCRKLVCTRLPKAGIRSEASPDRNWSISAIGLHPATRALALQRPLRSMFGCARVQAIHNYLVATRRPRSSDVHWSIVTVHCGLAVLTSF